MSLFLFYGNQTNHKADNFSTASAKDDVDRQIALTTVVVGGDSNNMLLSVSDTRRPATVKSVVANHVDKVDAFVSGASDSIDIEDGVTFLDQYGSVMNADNAKAFFKYSYDTGFDGYAYGLLVDIAAGTKLDIANDNVLVNSASALTPPYAKKVDVAPNATQAVNDTVKYAIVRAKVADKAAGVSGKVDTDKWDVVDKIKAISYTTVPVTKLNNLSIPAVNKQYVETELTDKANAAVAGKTVDNAEEAFSSLTITTGGKVKVTGTYDGKTLTVPEGYLSRDTTNFNYDVSDKAKITAVATGKLKLKDLYDMNTAQLTRKDGSLSATVNVYNTTESGSQNAGSLIGTCKTNIALSDEKPKATKIEWVLQKKAIESFTVNPSNTAFIFEDKTNAVDADTRIDNWNEFDKTRYWNPSVVVYDQYGQYYTTDGVEFTVKDYVENTGAFAHVENNSSIATNGSAKTTIKGAELGDTFAVTASIEGISASAKVTMGSDGLAFMTDTTDSDKTFRTTLLGYDR